MRRDAAAYEQMYALIRPTVRGKSVLELATGTGAIACHLADSASHIEATDASPDIIAQAAHVGGCANVNFCVQDMFHLPYGDGSFDVVIVANALHIVPEPEKALSEIERVLKPNGVMIAPTFTHAGNSPQGRVRAFFMKLVGLPIHSEWSTDEYLAFLRRNGWNVRMSKVLNASFLLTYTECVKSKD